MGCLLQYSVAVWAECCPRRLLLHLSMKQCLGVRPGCEEAEGRGQAHASTSTSLPVELPWTPITPLQSYTRFLLKSLKDIPSLTLLPVESTSLLAVLKRINNLHTSFT